MDDELTLLEVVKMTMPDVEAVGYGCPHIDKFKECFTDKGYECPKKDCHLKCEKCWNRIAKKSERMM